MIEINNVTGTNLVTYADYNSFKENLDRELMSEAESFVKVGYMLKVARDTNILTESGYKSVFEFAKAEYGLDTTMVSRYIGINDTYSVNGYSEMLEDKYKGFGYAKLSEMLTLPPAIVEELAPDMTREEIRTIKKEYQEEQQISDIEVAIEAASIRYETQEAEKTGSIIESSEYEPVNNMQRLIYDFFKDPEHAEEYAWLTSEEDQSIKELYEAIAPAGSRTIIGRIPGQGKMQLTIKEPEQKLAVISYRSGETEYYMWDDLAEYLNRLLSGEGSGRDKYKKVFEIDYPVNEKKEPEKSEPSAPVNNTEVKPKDKPKDKPKPKKVEVVKPKAEKKPAEKKEKKPEDKQEEKTEEKPEESLEVKQEEPEMVLTVEKEPEKADEEPKTEDSGSYEEENKIPAEAWHQRFLPYYEEWKTFIDKCNQCLYDVAEKDADPKDYRYLVKMADEYYRKASEELEKIRQLPEVEI
ncbi:MAG: hypothetical protein IJJ74_01265 [Eubacterium sp.]|nr:hypothetical protein [Eubacterium sp.]MBR0395899.1 hypothetical protein [Clostridiales bacterium]